MPMAGKGQRFVDAGYTVTKPMIDINGEPMIAKAIKSFGIDGFYIYIGQDFVLEDETVVDELRLASRRDFSCIYLTQYTNGAASTVLQAIDFINNDDPLIIVNSDQIIKWDSNIFLNLLNGSTDGVIALFNDSDPKWSYAELDKSGNVIRVAEKEVISSNASVGIYGWKRGSDFVKYAKQMIDKNITTNGEFYICPVYNEAIQDGKIISSMFVEEMYGVGTPEDLAIYLMEQNDT